MKEEWKNPKGITPQRFETNDGTWSIELCDEGMFTLITPEKEDWCFDEKELDVIINLLTAARDINPYKYENIVKEVAKETTSPFKFGCAECGTLYKTQIESNNCCEW
jgi:hypothetical protein